VQLFSGKLKYFIKIYYFTHGAASQYNKRKKCINLCYHKDDFGMDAMWHFFAVSHGKGGCVGIEHCSTTGVPPQGFRCAASFYKTLHIHML
jgi:hypothetical protein